MNNTIGSVPYIQNTTKKEELKGSRKLYLMTCWDGGEKEGK